jgi:hypothetical protein
MAQWNIIRFLPLLSAKMRGNLSRNDWVLWADTQYMFLPIGKGCLL